MSGNVSRARTLSPSLPNSRRHTQTLTTGRHPTDACPSHAFIQCSLAESLLCGTWHFLTPLLTPNVWLLLTPSEPLFFFFPHQFSSSLTPAGCPTTQLNPDTLCPERAQNSHRRAQAHEAAPAQTPAARGAPRETTCTTSQLQIQGCSRPTPPQFESFVNVTHRAREHALCVIPTVTKHTTQEQPVDETHEATG